MITDIDALGRAAHTAMCQARAIISSRITLRTWDEMPESDRDVLKAGVAVVADLVHAETKPELAAAIAKLEEIRRLCQDPHGMAPGQVWGGKPRHAGDPLAGIILDIIGQDDKPAPELQISKLTAERDEARADRDSYAERLRATDKSWTELAGERDALRTLVAEILTEFDASKGDGYRARVGQVMYRRWCERAGLTP